MLSTSPIAHYTTPSTEVVVTWIVPPFLGFIGHLGRFGTWVITTLQYTKMNKKKLLEKSVLEGNQRCRHCVQG